MRFVRRMTTIPVPEVFAFDGSLDNELGCPFILMEKVHGKDLNQVWFDQGKSPAMREQVRIRALQGIAEAMTQLNSLTFSYGGSLVFDAQGNVLGIGGMNVVDFETQEANMRSNDYDNTMAYCQIGPFREIKSNLQFFLNAREDKARKGKRERCEVEQGAYKLLRLLIEWGIMDTNAGEKPFVLKHPDLDSQNILVNDDGSLAGIIDWDRTAVVPRCVGCQSYPIFLMQDYDPVFYGYDLDAGRPMEGYLANSPAELASYRAMYAQFMESHLSKDDFVELHTSRGHAARVRKSRKEAANMTRRSLVMTSLHTAAMVPSQMRVMMTHVFDELAELTAAKWEEDPSTAGSGEQDHNKESGDECGDNDASEDGSSTAESGEQDNDEESGNESGDTAASKDNDVDAARPESCTQSIGSDETAVNTEQLSLDKLLEEIEKLESISSVGVSNHQYTQESTKVEENSPAEGKTIELGTQVDELNTSGHTKGASTPRVARMCGWLEDRLRRGAKRLHKDPNNDNFDASATSHSYVRPVQAARTVCGWAEKNLRRVARCLYFDDDKDDAQVESKMELVLKVAIGVLQGLQNTLKKLKEKLHCKGNDRSDSSEAGNGEVSREQQVASIPQQLTRAEKRSLCGRFCQMVQNNKLCLTVDQQVAIAQWVIKTLQTPDFSNESVSAADSHKHGKTECPEGAAYQGDSDSADDFENKEDQEAGHKNSTRVQGGNEDTEESEHHEKVAKKPESGIDQPPIPGIEATDSTKDEVIEVPQAAVHAKAEPFVQVDTGVFCLLDVCIALAKDDLDERRMQRLREGFCGLLNQTV